MTEFRHRKASDWVFENTLEIKTLEELLKYIKNLDCHSIIIDYDEELSEYLIKDYDNYVE